MSGYTVRKKYNLKLKTIGEGDNEMRDPFKNLPSNENNKPNWNGTQEEQDRSGFAMASYIKAEIWEKCKYGHEGAFSEDEQPAEEGTPDDDETEKIKQKAWANRMIDLDETYRRGEYRDDPTSIGSTFWPRLYVDGKLGNTCGSPQNEDLDACTEDEHASYFDYDTGTCNFTPQWCQLSTGAQSNIKLHQYGGYTDSTATPVDCGGGDSNGRWCIDDYTSLLEDDEKYGDGSIIYSECETSIDQDVTEAIIGTVFTRAIEHDVAWWDDFFFG